MAEHEPRLDRAVPDVALEPERRVDRLARARRRAARRIRTRPPRALRAARADREPQRGGPPPSGARRRTARRARAAAAPGLPIPHGSSSSSSSARSSPSSAPETTASTRSTGTSSSGVSTSAAWRLERLRGTRRSGRGRPSGRRPRGGRRSAPGARRPRAAPRAGRSRGCSAPSPEPSPSPSSATRIAGRWWRSTIREATIPITPGCQSSPASTYARRSPSSATWASASHDDPLLDRPALGVDARRARPRSRRRALGSSVSSSSRPASARRSRPAALIRGASRKPSVPASSALGSASADGHQRPQARSCGARQRRQPLAHEPAVLARERHQIGDRRQRHELEVLLGGRRAQRLGELERHAGPAQLGARIAAHAGWTIGHSGSRPSARGAWWSRDDHVEPRRARRGDLLDRGDRRSRR